MLLSTKENLWVYEQHINKIKGGFSIRKTTYIYDGKQLSGVTSLLSATLFKDKYSGIDEEILRKAAAYGTSVHETIELFETMGFDDVGNELTNYKKICKEHGIRALESEYLVSDNSRIASSIDLVMENAAREVVLADIKTTSGRYRQRLPVMAVVNLCLSFLSCRQAS